MKGRARKEFYKAIRRGHETIRVSNYGLGSPVVVVEYPVVFAWFCSCDHRLSLVLMNCDINANGRRIFFLQSVSCHGYVSVFVRSTIRSIAVGGYDRLIHFCTKLRVNGDA